MISRRLLISSAAAVGAAGFSGSLFAAAPDPVLGKDYIELRPPLEFPKKPIVVHDFFAYTCPHCLTFAPVMEKFIESVKGNPEVKVVPVPVAWNDDLAIFPHTYYAFEALGRMGDLHMEFWTWVIRGSHDWSSAADIEKDVLQWVGEHGLDQNKFRQTLGSFSVVSKARQATRTWKNYGVDSTPCVGVAGRYITAPHLVGTRQGTVDTVQWLINKIRQEK